MKTINLTFILLVISTFSVFSQSSLKSNPSQSASKPGQWVASLGVSPWYMPTVEKTWLIGNRSAILAKTGILFNSGSVSLGGLIQRQAGIGNFSLWGLPFGVGYMLGSPNQKHWMEISVNYCFYRRNTPILGLTRMDETHLWTTYLGYRLQPRGGGLFIKSGLNLTLAGVRWSNVSETSFYDILSNPSSDVIAAFAEIGIGWAFKGKKNAAE